MGVLRPFLDLSWLPSPAMCVASTLLTGALCLALYAWRRHPGTVLKKATRLGLNLTGMRQKYVRVSGIRLGYMERGTKRKGVPSLFMLHGFSADTNMYLPLVVLLPWKYHVVLIDLPGHGESDAPPDDHDLTLSGMTSVIKQFAMEIGLNREPFHILGTSLGGAISAIYSSMYPEDVAKATLVCPAMITPKETEFQHQVKNGKCLLLGNSLDDVATILDKCLYNKAVIFKNKQILLAISQQRARHTYFYERLFNVILEMIHQEQSAFEEILKGIRAPTQLIWGKDDELIHVSGIAVLKDHLPKCVQVDVLDQCGHIVSFDRPWSMAKVLKEFMAYGDKSCVLKEAISP